ncbi:hypothetical protein D3C84_1205300 [compost metagenome]
MLNHKQLDIPPSKFLQTASVPPPAPRSSHVQLYNANVARDEDNERCHDQV